MIGTVLSNRYKLLAELGSGGMAWVYLAQDLTQDQQVAVKVLYPQLGQDLGFLQRFSQEAKLVMSLSQSAPDRHVARVLDYGSDQDTHYLVMEYVAGRDLRKVLDEEGSLAWQAALDIGRQVALALGHAYRHSIVHRDIKPENVILLPDGTVRVLDFGIARARTSPTLTRSGFVGSPYYAAPEQAMGRRVDIRADLYSLGIVLYEILTGDKPFQADTPWAVINQHIATPPPLLYEIDAELPRSITRLVRKAMSKRPEDRFQTPAEMIQAIEAIQAGRDLPSETPSTEQEMMAPLLAGLYQRAQQAAGEQSWQEAVDLYSQILRFDPRYRDTVEQLAATGQQARLAALYAAGQQAIQVENWPEALAQLDQIAVVAPGYRDVRAQRTRARQKQEAEQLYQQGVRHADADEWLAAAECLAQVQDPEHVPAARLLEKARAEQARHREQARWSLKRAASPGQPAAARQRSLMWAIAVVLLLALAFETFLFYKTQQPPAVASMATTATSTAPGATGTTTLSPAPALPSLPAVALGRPSPTSTGRPTSPPQHTATAASTQATATPTFPASSTRPASATPTKAVTTAAASTSVTIPSISPATAARPLSTSPRRTPDPPPLAGQIAFPRFDPVRGTYDLFVCHVDGSACRMVVAGASQPDFLPQGDQLVAHTWQPEIKGLVLYALDGRLIWQISDQIEAARPSVDAQGQTYAYHSRQESDRLPRLYRTYVTETRPIKYEASVIVGLSPSWLPNGQLLYSGCLGNACGIIVTDADGSHPRQVVAGGSEANPEASPDGRRLVFMSTRDGNWEIYGTNLDGSGLQRLTRDSADDGLPTWSPDGHYIAFVSNRDGQWAVWAMRPDGSAQRRLFEIGGPLDGQVRDAAAHETHGWVEERISWAPLP